MATNFKHAEEFRIGAVKETMLGNKVGNLTMHSVVFSRFYRGGGQWKTTHTFVGNSLVILAKVADQAHSFIAERHFDPDPAGAAEDGD